jgi:hypothetical protein
MATGLCRIKSRARFVDQSVNENTQFEIHLPGIFFRLIGNADLVIINSLVKKLSSSLPSGQAVPRRLRDSVESRPTPISQRSVTST